MDNVYKSSQLKTNAMQDDLKKETLSLFDILEKIDEVKEVLSDVFKEALDMHGYDFVINKTFEAEQRLTHLERIIRRAAIRQNLTCSKPSLEEIKTPQIFI